MPSLFPSLRCGGLFRLLSDSGDSSDDPVSNSIECFACTQAGVPAFHSVSCDAADQPQWEASAGSSLFRPVGTGRPKTRWGAGRVLDPRSKRVKRWNRALVLARAFALAIDPLFFYVLSLGGAHCFYLNGWIAATATVLRTAVDSLHLCHVWLQFRLAYVSKESLVVGCGNLVWDPRAVANHYLRSREGFWFDVFVILPIPQVLLWSVVPKLTAGGEIKATMLVLQLVFLFQFFPRVYHFTRMTVKMQKVTGYIFSSIWWLFGLNFIAYWIASHVTGGFWYSLLTQRVASCLQQQCERRPGCDLSLSCFKEVSYGFRSFPDFSSELINTPCSSEKLFAYGIYGDGLGLIFSNLLSARFLYPIYWGLLNLSSFANELEPSSELVELTFCICIVLLGILLLTVSIGNIQIFLSVMMAKKRDMSLSKRDLEWWMARRQLPSHLQKRVHRFERQRWEVMGGEDEMELVKDLPEGLRRDIKRHLCLDLIKKVPFFHNLDDLILDNICDRVTPLVFSKDEKVIREGDPVQRMVFIVSGRVKSTQSLGKSAAATIVLEPGSFFGDELLSWALRRPLINRQPSSSATYVCLEPTEAFGIDAKELMYITVNFRYNFTTGTIKRTAMYYSSTWRTWAAVNIQFAWRRYKTRARGPAVARDGSQRVRQYAALLLSAKPHDHAE